jgi:hypothetical protein
MTEHTKKVLKRWLKPDYDLYHYFKKKLNQKINLINSNDLADELAALNFGSHHVLGICWKSWDFLGKLGFFFFRTPFNNYILVSVHTTPINFWSMTDRCLKFHLETLHLNGMSRFGDLGRFFETA